MYIPTYMFESVEYSVLFMHIAPERAVNVTAGSLKHWRIGVCI